MTDKDDLRDVKEALEGATPGLWHTVKRRDEDQASLVCFEGENFEGIVAECSSYHTGRPIGEDAANARLIAMAPDLAREYLRLKKVEEAARAMEAAWADSPTGSAHCNATWQMECAIADFHEAMEGE